MANVRIKEGHTWEEARDYLAGRGIILTRRMTKEGRYVCKASKNFRSIFEKL